MTPKQEAFVREYLVDLNAAGAARRAGYSAKTACSQGERLLRNVDVAAAITDAQQKRLQRVDLTADAVVHELMKIGFSDIRKVVKWASNVTVAAPDERELEEIFESGEVRHAVTNQVELIDSDEIDDATAAAVSEISQTDKGGLKVKLHDKRAALVDLGRHLGLFKERVEHTGKDGGPIQTEDVTVANLIEEAKRLGIDPASIGLG